MRCRLSLFFCLFAGLLQVALRAGLDVRVVVETNGDGYVFATMEDFHKLYPRHQDFIRMGNTRQRESLAALRLLGVPEQKVIFLSYPDRGTPALWSPHWSRRLPYLSPYSGDTRSPYPRTFNPAAVFAGEDLLADLRTILKDFRPDLISLPHPNDVHPDHRGLSAFARLAVALNEHEDPSYRPRLLAYLVHRHDFPEPQGLQPARPLRPPAALAGLPPGVPWLGLELDSGEVELKARAVRTFASQLPLMRGLLEGFIRSNELFQSIELSLLPERASGELLDPCSWGEAEGRPILPVQRDPVRDVLLRKLLPAADLVEVYAASSPHGGIEVCTRLDGSAQKELEYELRLTVAGLDGVRVFRAGGHAGGLPLLRRGPFLAASFPAAPTGRSWFVAVEAEVRQSVMGLLDQTAWTLLAVEPSFPAENNQRAGANPAVRIVQ